MRRLPALSMSFAVVVVLLLTPVAAVARPLSLRTTETSMSVAPSSAAPGEQVTVSASGLPPRTKSKTSIGSVLVDQSRTDKLGNLTQSVTVPVLANDVYEVKVVAGSVTVMASLTVVTPKPDATNTGPRAGTTLRPSGSITVATAGTVLEGLDVNGCILIEANDVTVRDSRVTCDGAYGIRARSGYSGITVEHVEVVMTRAECGIAAVNGYGITVRGSDLSGCADGIKARRGSLYEGNYVHVTRNPGTTIHLDAIQAESGGDFVVRGNNLDVPKDVGGNAAVIIKADFSAIDNVLVEGNWLNGGNFTVYSIGVGEGDTAKYPVSNVTIRNNRFGTDYRYGVLRELHTTNFVWTGNADDATSNPV